MSNNQNDPFLEREAQKYENPIPSREFILDLLKNSDAPMNRNDLFEVLGLAGEEHYEGLRRRLRAMERDGQLVYTRRQCYALPERLEMVKGTIIGHKDGFGWVRPEGSIGKDSDISLPFHQMRTVIHGDYVLVQPSGLDKRGRKEGRLVRLLEARKTQLVGRFFLEDGLCYVVPDDTRISQDILIAKEHRMEARMGNVVVFDITDRGGRSRGMSGQVVEVLGESMAPGMEIEIALRTHSIPNEWPNAVIQQVKNLQEEVPEEAKEGRVDLRDLPLVTIDGEDARDFDDAVFCEAKKSGGWRLWVAIADVSHYVRHNNALDKEAINRGNSVYFPAQVIPMLPEVLSNGLCSLNPQVDRLCMVCEITISASGKMSGYRHYEAVMNSHARLTYTKVGAILEGNDELRERYSAVVPHLEQLHEMYKVLKKGRAKRGAIEFETIETKFVFNAERKIERIEPVERNDAHKLIEECMILANIASAAYVEKLKEPALYRVHDTPSEERLVGFKDFLKELGLSIEGGLKPTPTDYAELIQSISERPDKELIQTMLLRSMKQAVYNPDNAGHFGLALKRYAHFTSPIRRYPDLLLHRAIKYLIAKDKDAAHEGTTPAGGHHYSYEQMEQYGEQCSMTERRADDATRDVSDWLKCEYMQDHVGDELQGVIANVTGFGFFVRLTELHIDGLVHITALDNDYYQFDVVGQRLVGESSGQIYRLGDLVTVKVLAVNLESRQIDFEIAGTKRVARGAGKTAKKKLRSQGKGDIDKRSSRNKRPDFKKSKPKAASNKKATPEIEATKAADKKTAKKRKPKSTKPGEKAATKAKQTKAKKTGRKKIKKSNAKQSADE